MEHIAPRHLAIHIFNSRYIFCMQVHVKNLRAVGSQVWDLMREGEAEKQVNL